MVPPTAGITTHLRRADDQPEVGIAKTSALPPHQVERLQTAQRSVKNLAA